MATCNDIVRVAMGRLRQIRAGATPAGIEAEDGMLALQSLYDVWVADGLFGRLNDVLVTASYTANEQDRIVNDVGATITLPLTIQPNTTTYAPVWPQDSGTHDYGFASSLPRPPRDLAMVEEITTAAGSTVMARYLYERVQRSWVQINGLLLTDNAPLAMRGMLGLSACLDEQLADSYGAQVSQATSRDATAFKWGLSAHYDSTRVAGRSDYF